MQKEYFLGLDIGTDSVGYAVTDTAYAVQRFNGKHMWGVNLFEAGNQTIDRRIQRSTRKRLQRVKQRVELIRELFAEEIGKMDSEFYKRLDESFLYQEDKSVSSSNSIFNDKGFTDKEYHKKYPTIHHLIMDLISNPEVHDIRLIYLAVSYIVSHRGHFLYDANNEDIGNILSFSEVYKTFCDCFEENMPWEFTDEQEIEKVFVNTKGITNTKNALTALLFSNARPDKAVAEIIKAISGGEFKLSVLFENEDYEELEDNKLSFSKADADERIEALLPEVDNDVDLINAMNGIYKWSAISHMLNGGKERYISNEKIRQYDKHKNDLKRLKKFVRKYAPKKYSEVFRSVSTKNPNYVSYSKNIPEASKAYVQSFKSATSEDFCGYIKKLFKNTIPDDADREDFKTMLNELDDNMFMPKQKNTDNRLIPKQLYWYELKSILNNVQNYYSFINQKDEAGVTVCDKILSVFEFRIPYYVGPLNGYNNKNAWIEKKAGRILPWNFDEMVDHEKSEEAFIRRMTRKCSYIAGEDVLPKNSLLYSKFMVLNEINNIQIDGTPISVALKQELYNELFLIQNKKITKSAIKKWLISKGYKVDNISGVDDTLNSTMKPFHSFKKMLSENILSENDAERIIARITMTTDKKRLKAWLSKNYSLSEKDITYIANLKFTDFGRLSYKLLNEIEAVDVSTGELYTIIRAMWDTNNNLMQLLGENSEFRKTIDSLNKDYYSEYGHSISSMLDEMYVSNAVKRPIFRTLDIVKEIEHINKCAPKKIFVEMARSEQKKIRTKSRKMQLLEAYKQIDASYKEIAVKLKNEDENRLKSKKLYLYYLQLGRSLYSGKPIDIERLMHDNTSYDIDHIYPQARVKDDSFNNLALVEKEENGKKSDNFPISSDIREKMYSFWRMLADKKLISQEKLHRLTRSDSFTEEELSGFINRQLVETSQSTKAVATILKSIMPETEIVYVKAGLVSEFRKAFDLTKCREINDFHHAKDAYLNIVMGNIYNVRFTKNPINFIREKDSNKNYSIKLTQKKGQGMLAYDIERNGEVAWKADGTTLKTVMNAMNRNSINYVRYPICRKGQLFNLTINKAPHIDNDLVPIKKGLDTAKYGGYNNTTATFFTLVKHKDNGNDCISILPIDLLIADKFKSDDEFALNYLAKRYKINNPRFIGSRKILKINTLIEMDNGFRACIASKSNGGAVLVLSSATSLVTDKPTEDYIKRIESKITKAKENRVALVINPEFDKITKEENSAVYDILVRKANARIFSGVSVFKKIGDLLAENKALFELASLDEQIRLIASVVSVFKTGRTTGCDLTLVGGSKQSGIITLSSKINKNICIIDQNPTGLFEKKSENLLTL